jgi:Response regulator containing CheY-like receiver domain and AraC-type DNA-binding domain
LKPGSDSLFQKILFVETPPPSFTRGILIYLIADINRQLGKTLDIDSRILETPDFSIVGEILSVESLRSRTQKYLLKLKNTVIPQSRLQNDPIILSTIRYVDSNISKAGISASEIAGKLNLSDTYFSTIFKAKTGETFRSYVLKRKNEYAKKLLADRSLSMDDIACNLGYTDYRSFHRLFKQLNGISPTEYRKGLSQ